MTSDRARRLWEELFEIWSNQQAWDIIQRHLDEHALDARAELTRLLREMLLREKGVETEKGLTDQ